jgi:hypothetical protein
MKKIVEFNGKEYENRCVVEGMSYLVRDINNNKYEAISAAGGVLFMHQLFEKVTNEFIGLSIIEEAGLLHRNEGIVINYLT